MDSFKDEVERSMGNSGPRQGQGQGQGQGWQGPDSRRQRLHLKQPSQSPLQIHDNLDVGLVRLLLL
jgi:hypothetical protein